MATGLFFLLIAFFFQNCGKNSAQSSSPTPVPNPGVYTCVLNNGQASPECGEQVLMKEFFNLDNSLDLNRTTGRFFITGQPTNLTAMTAPALSNNFVRTNNTYTIFKTAVPSSVPLYRYLNTNNNYHFYLPGVPNQARPALPGFTNESIEGYVYPVTAGSCPNGSLPVFRFFYGAGGLEDHHRFTADNAIKNKLLALSGSGWVSEQIGFCANAVTIEQTPVEPPAVTVFQGYSKSSLWITTISGLLNRVFFQIVPSGTDPLLQDGFVYENNSTGNHVPRSYKVLPSAYPGSIPLYRYFSAASSAHVYSNVELYAPGLTSNGIVAYTRAMIDSKCPTASTAVYNMYLPNGVSSTDASPRNLYLNIDQKVALLPTLSAGAARDDGIAFCSFK